MTSLTTTLDVDAAWRTLVAKYAIPVPAGWRLGRAKDADAAGTVALVPGHALLPESSPADAIPLFPWRNERRFVELRRLLLERTVDPLLLCRFSCATDGTALPLRAILYRELDLCQWLSGSAVRLLFATIHSERAANLVVRLASGALASVEASVQLPAGSPPVDRHELIARRGVASDRVVDSQVPQHSVYLFTPEGQAYTDTDAELFGLDADGIHLVRAAYELAQRPESAAALQSDHARLCRLVDQALQSERACRPSQEGGAA